MRIDLLLSTPSGPSPGPLQAGRPRRPERRLSGLVLPTAGDPERTSRTENNSARLPQIKLNHGSAKMAPIKDSGSEFHWSRPRIVGLVFSLILSPIFLISAGFGHVLLGLFLFCIAGIALVIAYCLPTPLRKFMRGLIPTSAEKAELSRLDPS